MEASLEFEWQSALGGRYSSLSITNRMKTDDGQEFLFQGIAYYQVNEEEIFTGVWVDSQGDIMPIKAKLHDQTLVANWGTLDAKHGRSTYRLMENGQLEVTDEVGNDKGKYSQFGHSVLSRKPEP